MVAASQPARSWPVFLRPRLPAAAGEADARCFSTAAMPEPVKLGAAFALVVDPPANREDT